MENGLIFTLNRSIKYEFKIYQKYVSKKSLFNIVCRCSHTHTLIFMIYPHTCNYSLQYYNFIFHDQFRSICIFVNQRLYIEYFYLFTFRYAGLAPPPTKISRVKIFSRSYSHMTSAYQGLARLLQYPENRAGRPQERDWIRCSQMKLRIMLIMLLYTKFTREEYQCRTNFDTDQTRSV